MERTGKNPQNIYLQLGCSKHAEQKMLAFVRNHCIGKPFSNLAMFLSLLWPRQTDNTSFFCAGEWVGGRAARFGRHSPTCVSRWQSWSPPSSRRAG